MARPKGSKNKKSRKITNPDMQIEQMTAEKTALEAEQAKAQTLIAEQTGKLKEIKKQVRVLDRKIAKLQEQKAAEEAAAEAAEKEQEVQNKIAGLLAAGKSYDEILSMLQ